MHPEEKYPWKIHLYVDYDGIATCGVFPAVSGSGTEVSCLRCINQNRDSWERELTREGIARRTAKQEALDDAWADDYLWWDLFKQHAAQKAQGIVGHIGARKRETASPEADR